MPYPDSDYERSWKMQTKGVTLYPATLERLYAAAPDLLAALKAAKDELIILYEQLFPDDESDNDTTAAIDGALDAIAKAEGKGA